MNARILLLALFGVWICESVVAEVLANSGYPMLGANPERNYKVDRSVLCPQVAPGRTTVLTIDWFFPPRTFSSLFYITSTQLTLDDNGYLYVAGFYNEATTNIFRVNATDGSFNVEDTGILISGDSFSQDAHPTHVKNNKFYLAPSGKSFIVDSSLMQSIASTDNPYVSSFTAPSSFVPYGNTLMVKSMSGMDTGMSLVYIDASGNIDTNAPNALVGYETLPVLVYKDTTPVVVNPGASPTTVYNTVWTKSFPGNAKKAWLDGDNLFYISNYPSTSLVRINMTDNNDYVDTDLSNFKGASYSWDLNGQNSIYHNGILFTQIEQDGNTLFVDLLGGTLIPQESPKATLGSQPIYLKQDNMVLALTHLYETSTLQVRGLEWGTWKTKMVAQFNGTYFADNNYGLPIVGENCRMYTVLNDKVYSFSPLPIQNVVPILQCVDLATNEAYFSYRYMGSRTKDFVIPHLPDRNELTPEGVAPWTDFTTGEGPLYPLSYKVLLNNATTHKWVLEDYTLTFSVGSSLACPASANVVIRLSANSAFPQGFQETVRKVFARVAEITDSRVTVVAKKRSVGQTDTTLETELQVAPDPTNNEPAPSEVVRNFVENQQDLYQTQVQSSPGAPVDVKVDDVVGQKTDKEVEGVLPPQAVPQAPVSPPVAAPISTPIAPTSTASNIGSCVTLVFATILYILY